MGRNKIKCRKKNDEEKAFKSTRQARDYARENFKKGDSVRATFDNETYEITKLQKMEKKNYANKGYGNRNTSKEMTEMSVYKTVGTIVSGLEDVTTKNVEEIVAKLYDQGLALVKGKSSTKEEEVKEEVDDEDNYENEEEEIEE